MAKQTGTRAHPKRKISAPTLPVQRQLPLAHEGEHHDLLTIFHQLNREYFNGKLRGYQIRWGQRRRLRPQRYVVLGSIQEEDRVIRIHPLLDAPFVPVWFLEYVIYHEMLHAVVPDEIPSEGRRRVHTEEFNRRERAFRHYQRARRWEQENLFRFLR